MINLSLFSIAKKKTDKDRDWSFAISNTKQTSSKWKTKWIVAGSCKSVGKMQTVAHRSTPTSYVSQWRFVFTLNLFRTRNEYGSSAESSKITCITIQLVGGQMYEIVPVSKSQGLHSNRIGFVSILSFFCTTLWLMYRDIKFLNDLVCLCDKMIYEIKTLGFKWRYSTC